MQINEAQLPDTADLVSLKEYLAEQYRLSFAQFSAGVSAREIVYQRAAIVDRVMLKLWQASGLDDDPVALLAVGGYGRGELHPFSDVDIAVLLGSEPDQEQTMRLEQFVTSLWDLGLEIGHSVRTVQQTIDVASEDLTIMTNLMESRLIAGPLLIFDDLKTRLNDPSIWPPKAFFNAKLAEQAKRHRKYGEAFQRLEPNLKGCPGGLRDIQVIAWVANRHFGSAGLAALVEHEFLSEQEYERLHGGETFLWRIRCALHFLTGRHEDRLLFDHQKAVAEMLGYVESTPNSAVEHLMKDYYRAIRELSCLNEMLLGLFDEAILENEEERKLTPINRRFQAVNGALEIRDERVFIRSPYAMLEVFLVLQRHPEIDRIRAGTIRLLLANRHRIDKKFREDLRARSLFMEIIRQPRRIGHELQRMHRYGILSAYLEVFAKVEGLMQFDLFHIFTVDEHTLFVVRYMRRFSFPQDESDKIALVPHVVSNIPKLELLYIAGLFHDIAKGRGGDHSSLGADEAVMFCQNHGLSNFDTHLVAWLVRSHLLMSTTSQRKDIYDQNVVEAFAKEVGKQIYLDYLYLLTIADIRGTNPELWNGWKESLLAELYTATRKFLASSSDDKPDVSQQIEETKESAREILENSDVRSDRVTKLWDTLDADYFLRHRPYEIAWHAEAISRATSGDLPMVKIENFSHRAATSLFVYTYDAENLFARTTAALSTLNLNVQDARIVTSSDGYTLDTYMILNSFDQQPITDDLHIKKITDSVRLALENDKAIEPQLTRAASRALKHFSSPVLVDFTYDEIHQYTIMSVNAIDRPGLLSTVGEVMRTHGIRLHDARIATIGERAEDFFCITNASDDPEVTLAQQSKLREALIESLST